MWSRDKKIMSRVFNFIAFIVFFLATGVQLSSADRKSERDGNMRIEIVWDTPEKVVGRGGYPRVHRLNDNRLMLCYERGADNYIRFSEDNGLSWSEEEYKVMAHFIKENDKGKARLTASNPEFAQLSSNNPYHPGRIIFACNYRPKWIKPGVGEENPSSVHPYTISIKTSDDNGVSWSKLRHVYKSGIWEDNVLRGCWEPFVLELPDGVVQIYFADETPYWKHRSKWQNISVIESRDGGESWSEPRVVSQNGVHRDGMPVVTIHDGMLIMAVETTEDGSRMHPIVICNSVEDNWKTTVGVDSDLRFHPFRRSVKSDIAYSGAPYIITTDNYLVYSYQISDASDDKNDNNTRHSAMEVQVCHKAEISDGRFLNMRSATRPIKVDQWTETAVWNSLCDLGNDEILAVSQYQNAIWIVRGRILSKNR